MERASTKVGPTSEPAQVFGEWLLCTLGQEFPELNPQTIHPQVIVMQDTNAVGGGGGILTSALGCLWTDTVLGSPSRWD